MQQFNPPFWLKNPHLLTIIASLLPRGKDILKQPMEATLVRVDDHSEISVYCHLQPDFSERPTLILVHGLEGSAHSFYITSLTQNALAAKSNVVRVNLRSCGGHLHLTPTLYHAGQSADLLKLIDFLKESKGLSHFFLVGFSLGGNMVLKAAAELGSNEIAMRGVCAIAPSIDLDLCVTALERGFNWLYSRRFLRSLKRKIIQKQQLVPERFDLSHLPSIKSIRQFDDVYTARDAGYLNAAHYYHEASALPRLKHISVPTQIIAAQDDPFIPFQQFRDVETDTVRLMATKYGGHVGFIPTFNTFTDQKAVFSYWLDEQILNFCLECMNIPVMEL